MMIKGLRSYFRKRREKILVKRYGNTIGKRCAIADNAEIFSSELYDDARVAAGASVRDSIVGKFSAIGRNTKVAHSHIGSYCAVSWDVTINATFHHPESLTNSAFPYVPRVGGFVSESLKTIQEVHIHNDVWIGTHAVIMPGVSVGDGAVVGAGAIVTSNVPPYAVVMGIPAKISRYRFHDEVIERLLKIQWWQLEEEIIRANIQLFQGKFSKEKLAKLEDICK